MPRFGQKGTAGTGRGVTIYTLDSGVLASHREFQTWGGNVSRASYGYSFLANSTGATALDCNGHGTHTASTAIGSNVGVAKEAEVVAVQVLGCEGDGTVSQVLAGLDWVARSYQPPAIVAMSLGTQDSQESAALDAAVTSLVEQYNITVVVAAGNQASNSCIFSPAHSPNAITVGATDSTNKFSAVGNEDLLYSYTNTGPCVSLFAPGVNILGACGGPSRCPAVNDSAYTWASGTSMSTPHVAGLAAIYLSTHPEASPAQGTKPAGC
ncbi:hypothetical protein WJX73_010803 [Symbiochloris irregularis]|uniref:Peptidase S8/S53 domain-containing protein n=1 Tax=Symbiochloris irregularis TaxID=706552 RepID=A0AAW1NUJ9_9CHLO